MSLQLLFLVQYKPCEDGKVTKKYDKVNKTTNWVVDCCTTCQNYIAEIQNRSVKDFEFQHFNWNNSDRSKWSTPDGGWEMAKVFMSQGQTKSQQDAQDTDLSGILNFINHCDLARSFLQDVTLLGKVSRSANLEPVVREQAF